MLYDLYKNFTESLSQRRIEDTPFINIPVKSSKDLPLDNT